LESEAWKHLKASGTQRWREFGTPAPRAGPLDAAREVAEIALGALGIGSGGVTDNASVNIVPLSNTGSDGKTKTVAWAMTETVVGTIAFDPDTLGTLGRVKYDDTLRGDLTTAHPVIQPDGSIINLISAVGVGWQLYKQAAPLPGAAPRRELLARVPHRKPLAPAWTHAFPCSQEYAVIPEVPLYFNLKSLTMGGATPFIFMDWAPQDGVLLHVVGLTDGNVRTFKVRRPFFVFHWGNTFVSNGGKELCIDAAVYDDPEILNDLYLDRVKAEWGESSNGSNGGSRGLSQVHYRRLTLDLSLPAGSEVEGKWEGLSDEDITGGFAEFPSVNAGNRGVEYRFAWVTCAVRPTNVSMSSGFLSGARICFMCSSPSRFRKSSGERKKNLRPFFLSTLLFFCFFLHACR
jgi:carlactone synthase / all-trans-10'-apo-beta-carotenal 13,14-cleaving dioxygenase